MLASWYIEAAAYAAVATVEATAIATVRRHRRDGTHDKSGNGKVGLRAWEEMWDISFPGDPNSFQVSEHGLSGYVLNLLQGSSDGIIGGVSVKPVRLASFRVASHGRRYESQLYQFKSVLLLFKPFEGGILS